LSTCVEEREARKGKEGKRKVGKMIAYKRKFRKAKSLSPRPDSEEEEVNN